MRVARDMHNNDLHYMAGVIDSDGSIYVSVERAGNSKLGYRIRPRFMLSMKDSKETRKAMELFTSYADDIDVNYSAGNSSSKDGVWRFSILGNSNVVEFLEPLTPFLRIKKKQSQLVVNADWPQKGGKNEPMHSKVSRFMNLVEVREKIRQLSADRSSKYNKAYFKEEFNDVMD